MGIRNYLIEGVSGTGKTSVATELQRRGHHVIHGDRELAYKGNPLNDEPLAPSEWALSSHDPALVHAHHLWDIDKVRSLVSDQAHDISFFCGGSRNFRRFIDLFDGVFVLDIDLEALKNRLAERPKDEFGGRPAERELIMRLHATGEDIPENAMAIDATQPLEAVVGEILRRCDKS
jgi:broad-specificity NMP kinase